MTKLCNPFIGFTGVNTKFTGGHQSSHIHTMSQPNHDSKPSLPLATKRKECIHEFQCPNPMCMRPFDTQRGLSLHFHNSNNLFCNPSPQYRTTTEQTFTFKLPPNQEPCDDTSKHLGTDLGEDDDTSFPCWSDGDSNSVDGLSSEDVGDPLNVHVNDGHPADKKKTTGFGLAYTDAQYVETKLAKILNDIQAPKFVYSSVLKWAREAHTLGYNFVPRHGTKDSLISSLQSQLHLDHFRPEKICIELPGDKMRVEVTRFNFVDGLHSLLSHPDLTGTLDNLDVNPVDPFGKYVSPDGNIGPVNSAGWYKKAYQTCVKDPSTDLLVPICFACDEAKLTGGSTAGCWPLMFSTTLFNQKLRNQPLAWRPLGYIYDLTIDESNSMREGQSIHLKYQRLHAIFETILATLLEAQQPHALDGINVSLGGVTKCVNLKVPICFIIGDMQGGDKICSCSPCYSNTMQRLCRKCNVKGSDADDPFFKCKRMIMSRIQQLVVDGEYEKLDNINQYHVHNAWFPLDYGGCKYGIFSAACVVEALHALENGLMKQSLQILIQDHLSLSGRIRLDKLVKEFRDWDRQHYLSAGTEKTMPRLLFKDGISKLTDITASTNVGIMLTVVVLSLTSKGNHFFNVTLGPLKAQQMRYVFQQLLCYWMWLKKDFYWKAGDTIAKEAARTAIQTMLAQLVALWPRDRGQGWQTAKHHEQIHVPDDIDSLGAHQNYHTGSSEHNHIDNIKKPAKMTQGRKSVLDWQIANRRADAYILDLAYDAMKTKVPGFESKVDPGVQNGLSRLASKGIFELQRHPDRIDVNFGWTSESDPGRIPREISDYITLYFSRYHMLDSDTLQLPFFTEYKRQGEVFRAHPNYRQAIGPWFDWAMFRWDKEERQSRRNRSTHAVDVAHMDAGATDGEYDYAPAKLMGFVEIENEIMCIVRPCSTNYTKSSVFTTQWELAFWDRKKREPMICLVSVDAIVRHCLMIPRDGPESNVYHEVWERKLWADEFHK
jgi:hypothetical protein